MFARSRSFMSKFIYVEVCSYYPKTDSLFSSPQGRPGRAPSCVSCPSEVASFLWGLIGVEKRPWLGSSCLIWGCCSALRRCRRGSVAIGSPAVFSGPLLPPLLLNGSWNSESSWPSALSLFAILHHPQRSFDLAMTIWPQRGSSGRCSEGPRAWQGVELLNCLWRLGNYLASFALTFSWWGPGDRWWNCAPRHCCSPVLLGCRPSRLLRPSDDLCCRGALRPSACPACCCRYSIGPALVPFYVRK